MSYFPNKVRILGKTQWHAKNKNSNGYFYDMKLSSFMLTAALAPLPWAIGGVATRAVLLVVHHDFSAFIIGPGSWYRADAVIFLVLSRPVEGFGFTPATGGIAATRAVVQGSIAFVRGFMAGCKAGLAGCTVRLAFLNVQEKGQGVVVVVAIVAVVAVVVLPVGWPLVGCSKVQRGK